MLGKNNHTIEVKEVANLNIMVTPTVGERGVPQTPPIYVLLR